MLLNQIGGGGTPGKSAYQIAVDNGFVGTEAEWLASLEGENGHTPVKGVDYTDGAPSTVPGPSAYQIAVSEGFTGTEPEWVASLEGDPGTPSTVPGPAGTTDYTALINKPSTFPPSTHAHAPGDVTGTAVVTNDGRLSDARTPTAHNQAISTVTNLQTALDAKAASSHSHAESDVTNLATDLGNKITANGAITSATKTKVTYDTKGLVTSGADATTADIADSSDKRYCTDVQKTVIGNTSGSNTGDSSTPAETGATIATLHHAASAKSALLDADEVTGGDSAASFGIIRSTWTNIKAFLKTYFDTIYAAVGSATFIGTTSHTLNRASSAETIAGLTLTTPNIGAAIGTSVVLTGAITSSGAGIGYASGAGGTVTQSAARTTGVTLSKLCGNITMYSAAQAAYAMVTFTLTNTFIAATDYLLVQHISATNGGAWSISTVCAAGSATINIRNVTNASITEATPLRFTIIKGVTA